jgi:membrane protein YdbS with pleckstrin-like domain
VSTTIRRERPSATAIIANRGLDAVVILVGCLIIALPFFMMVKEIGIAFIVLDIVGVLLIVMRMLFDLLEREYSLYSLELDRLIVDRGIFSHQRIVVPLDASHVQRVSAYQPYLGRIIGYGHVLVLTAGWGAVQLRYVSDPYAWQENILRQLVPSTTTTKTAASVQTPSALPNAKIAGRKVRQLLLAISGLFILVCVCSLMFSVSNMALAQPTPTPTPTRGVLVLPNWTFGDMFGVLWSIYQIPTVFWLVNLAIVGNVVIFVLQVIANRKR